jgi:hypothetical protein
VKPVTITIGDVAHHGTYFLRGSMVHVQSLVGAKATRVGGSPPEMIARLLLSELLRAASATD